MDNPTEITIADIDAVVQTLLGNDADFITNMMGGENKIGTAPVLDAFFGMGHTDLITELRNVTGFIEKAQYPKQEGVSVAEVGTASNVRFMLSSRGSISTGSSLLTNNIFNIFVTGSDAYGVVEQTSQSAAFIYHPPGHGKVMVIAVDKSSLMDSKLSACNDGDNEAQATERWAA